MLSLSIAMKQENLRQGKAISAKGFYSFVHGHQGLVAWS